MPFHVSGEDPGTDFVNLLRQNGLDPFPPALPGVIDAGHATTVLALRFAGGVVVAGDRRATSGHLISHRDMQKVFPADEYSAVAIAGAAGPAIQMVRVFQLQLEYYEKIEGKPLTLEGKANQLAEMLRGHLPQAMQGLAVVPIFAGFDPTRGAGRLFQFDVTGGRYEEQDFATSGSGSLHAGTVVKLGYTAGLTEADALTLSVKALWHAADEDSATGGPDPIRGIYPVLAVIDNEGFRQLSDEESGAVFADFREELTEG
ncbi:MAG TPA: proteasome subunit beta [Acidimicrobiaceae bacterium]|nr:proteasome subunit beta [Acidimicrobiaceae bacterium]|tara:strand:+ start:1583 stop:2359 length:777 start_codon:yes stop_codon:yes gene_type:complete